MMMAGRGLVVATSSREVFAESLLFWLFGAILLFTRSTAPPHFVAMRGTAQLLALVAVGLFENTAALASMKSQMSPRSTTAAQNSLRPFYSDSEIQRDRSHVLADLNENLYLKTTKFVLQTQDGMLYKSIPTSKQREPRVEALYFSAVDVDSMLGDSLSLRNMVDSGATLAWLGKYKESDYWVLFADEVNLEPTESDVKPLREFGDRLESITDAGVLATANGLVEFHKSHPFCSQCGSRSIIAKAGACRRCSGCKKSTYPRIDLASIMLITSSCGNYGLFGRKKAWPKGRYSTLAGFAEVGETIEDCCIRETFEESGVVVDPSSVTFVASQPWPFPRSLMVGFQAKAYPQAKGLPKIQVDVDEMEDIQWFSKDYVRERLEGGSTALGYDPTAAEQEFHIPGRSSLARLLITRWANSSDDFSEQ